MKIKIILFILIAFVYSFTLNADVYPQDSLLPNTNTPCSKFKSDAWELFNMTDRVAIDQVIQRLIEERRLCPEEFIQFSKQNVKLFNNQQRAFIANFIDTLIQEQPQILDEYISTLVWYHYELHKYEIAKKVDLDFFDEFKMYHLRNISASYATKQCRPTSSELIGKFKPIAALINMGDTTLENKWINSLRVVYDSLVYFSIHRYEEKRSGVVFNSSINEARRFIRSLGMAYNKVYSFRLMDAIFDFARYQLSDSFVYFNEKGKVALTGIDFIQTVILSNLKLGPQKQASNHFKQIYYQSCEDFKTVYLCDEAWQEALVYYKNLREDRSVWQQRMFLSTAKKE